MCWNRFRWASHYFEGTFQLVDNEICWFFLLDFLLLLFNDSVHWDLMLSNPFWHQAFMKFCDSFLNNLRGPFPSTRGPWRTHLWCTNYHAHDKHWVAKCGVDNCWKHLRSKYMLKQVKSNGITWMLMQIHAKKWSSLYELNSLFQDSNVKPKERGLWNKENKTLRWNDVVLWKTKIYI